MAEAVQLRLAPESILVVREIEHRWGRATLYQVLDHVLDRQGSLMARSIVAAMKSLGLERRTGTLARSVLPQSERLAGVPALRVGIFRGPALRYAGVQEFGTRGKEPTSPYPDIVPKRAKALAIPARGGRALTPAGVDRFGGPTKYPGTLRFIPFRRGIAVGALYDERDLKRAPKDEDGNLSLDQIKAVYLLLRKVSIKGKHYLRTGALAYLPRLAGAMAKDLAQAMATLSAGTPRG